MPAYRVLFIGSIPDLGDLDRLDSEFYELGSRGGKVLRRLEESGRWRPGASIEEQLKLFISEAGGPDLLLPIFEQIPQMGQFVNHFRQFAEVLYEDSLKSVKSGKISFVGACGHTRDLKNGELPYPIYDLIKKRREYSGILVLHSLLPPTNFPEEIVDEIATAYQQYYARYHSERTRVDEKQDLCAFVVAHDTTFVPEKTVQYFRQRDPFEVIQAIEKSISCVYTFDFKTHL